jgi:hypothetical protein
MTKIGLKCLLRAFEIWPSAETVALGNKVVLWVCSRCPSTVNVIGSTWFPKITLLFLFVVGFAIN